MEVLAVSHGWNDEIIFQFYITSRALFPEGVK
jgi:hypothetical protein